VSPLVSYYLGRPASAYQAVLPQPRPRPSRISTGRHRSGRVAFGAGPGVHAWRPRSSSPSSRVDSARTKVMHGAPNLEGASN